MLGYNDTKTGSREPEFSYPAGIKALIHRFQVCWEVYPAEILAKDGIRKIGFDLELYGTPECGTEHVDPGCQHCLRVESALREIADWILPRVKPSCSFDVDSEGDSLSYAPERRNRPDVVVHINILHRHEWDHAIDECEEVCLKEIEQVLTDLGVCRRSWSDARDESRAGPRAL
jgi:hypothetical protein